MFRCISSKRNQFMNLNGYLFPKFQHRPCNSYNNFIRSKYDDANAQGFIKTVRQLRAIWKGMPQHQKLTFSLETKQEHSKRKDEYIYTYMKPVLSINLDSPTYLAIKQRGFHMTERFNFGSMQNKYLSLSAKEKERVDTERKAFTELHLQRLSAIQQYKIPELPCTTLEDYYKANYNSKNLLAKENEWMDAFGSLTNEQFEQAHQQFQACTQNYQFRLYEFTQRHRIIYSHFKDQVEANGQPSLPSLQKHARANNNTELSNSQTNTP